MAKLTFEDQYHKITIEVNKEDLSIGDLWDMLVLPMLTAIGYNQDTINKYFELGES